MLHLAIGLGLALSDLHRPTCIRILLRGLRALIRPDFIG